MTIFYDDIINLFSGKLRNILEYEMSNNNVISEVFQGDWQYPDTVVIILEKPFTPPILKELDGIEFRNVNDPHYWKAEYYDSKNNLLLCCKFGGVPDFSDL